MRGVEWAAGLFEGEGCVSIRTHDGRVRLSMTQADTEVLEEFKRVVECGAIYDHGMPDRVGRKKLWHWEANAAADVERTLRLLLPWMCARRAERFTAALERLAC